MWFLKILKKYLISSLVVILTFLYTLVFFEKSAPKIVKNKI